MNPRIFLAPIPLLLASTLTSAQIAQKISDTQGGFTGFLDDQDRLGKAVAPLGDLDGDGVPDLAVSASGDDDGGTAHGAVWILFLNADGTVKTHQKISDTLGGFTGVLDDSDIFGASLASIGDLDGDGIQDLAVGANFDDDGGTNAGALWVLFLNSDGTVKAHQKISSIEGGFTGGLDGGDSFGASVASLGDLDHDGVRDVVVGATGDDDGGTNRGAAWVLFLNGDGTVKGHQKISSTAGGFSGLLDASDFFGGAVAALGDVDGDGVQDLAVGVPLDDDGAADQGAVWVLFLNSDGTVKGHQKISATAGGFGGALSGDAFGTSVAGLGDLDGNGVGDLAVGDPEDDDGPGFSNQNGAVWVLFLNPDGTVKGHMKIAEAAPGFTFPLLAGDNFGASVCLLGDVDGDCIPELAVGATGDGDGGGLRGATWVLTYAMPVASHRKISALEGEFSGALDGADLFGFSSTPLGDLDGDGVGDIAVGAVLDDDGLSNNGAVWILFLNADGTVKSHQKISATSGGLVGPLGGDRFGWSVARVNDLDLDGVDDLVVGEALSDDGGTDRGAVWVLFLNANGTVKAEQKISSTAGGFTGLLDASDFFGGAVAALGDLDMDGIDDIAVGAFGDDDDGVDTGAVWILFLNANGTVKAHQKVSDTEGGFLGTIDAGDQFGNGVAGLGDLDGNGVTDLAVGAPLDDDGGTNTGAVWILFLNADGTVLSHRKISETTGGFPVNLFNSARFGSVAAPGDLNGDGNVDLVVGARTQYDGANDTGVVYVLYLGSSGIVTRYQAIGVGQGGFSGDLDNLDGFGRSVTACDIDLDGYPELVVGADLDDDGGLDSGALWVLGLQGPPPPATVTHFNGLGINVPVLTSSPAVLGSTWTVTVTADGHSAPGRGYLLLSSQPLMSLFDLPGPTAALDPSQYSGSVLSIRGGPPTELLLSTPVYLRLGSQPHSGSGGAAMVFSATVPPNLDLCGLPWAVQAVVTGGHIDLSSAASGVIGH